MRLLSVCHVVQWKSSRRSYTWHGSLVCLISYFNFNSFSIPYLPFQILVSSKLNLWFNLTQILQVLSWFLFCAFLNCCCVRLVFMGGMSSAHCSELYLRFSACVYWFYHLYVVWTHRRRRRPLFVTGYQQGYHQSSSLL